MKTHARLPKIISVIFAVFCWIFAFMAAMLLVAIVVDPNLPTGGVVNLSIVDLVPKPGSMVIHADKGGTVFTVTGLSGTLNGTSGDGAELFTMIKRYLLPMGMLFTAFLAVLFDLLRRLFRNVGRGDSFTPGNMRLVYAVGFLLIVYSLASAAADSWLMTALADYVSHHLSFAGEGMRIVVTSDGGGSSSFTVSFGGSAFFSGLLVLALAEVFRQGLKLKEDSELTI